MAKVIARGCEALGYEHSPLRRNAPECDGQGVCCFGCPTDAKRSTNVSYVPLALKAGATLFTGLRVERVMVDGGRAVGVVATARPPGRRLADADGARARDGGRLRLAVDTAAARIVGHRHVVGPARAQLVDPSPLGVMALFDEKLDGSNAIPQGYAIEQFHDEGILFEGAFARSIWRRRRSR